MNGGNARTPLFIVCSPQPRTGCTLVARLLVDFFLMEGRPVAAFDFAAEPPSLIDFLPGYTVRADVTEIGGQMALFDRIIVSDGTAKVVDLSPIAFQQFFSVMSEIAFVADARERGMEPIVLFLAAPDAISQRSYSLLQRRFPEMALVPVYNEMLARADRARKNYAVLDSTSVAIQIPALAPLYRRFLDQPPFSFAAFRGAPPDDIPLDTYMELLRWMRRACVEFRELELRLLLNDVRLSLQPGTG